MISRRAFALGALGALQPPKQDPGAADPLRDPSIVGRSQNVIAPVDNHETIKTIEHRLKCTCPCGLDVFTCRTTDFTCTYSPALHAEVVAMFEQGKGTDEIIAAFVAKYGESILLAPPTKGFNLVGYLLPGTLVLAVGGTLAFVLLRRHRMRLVTAEASRPAPRAAAAPSDADQARLARLLDELDQ